MQPYINPKNYKFPPHVVGQGNECSLTHIICMIDKKMDRKMNISTDSATDGQMESYTGLYRVFKGNVVSTFMSTSSKGILNNR